MYMCVCVYVCVCVCVFEYFRNIVQPSRDFAKKLLRFSRSKWLRTQKQVVNHHKSFSFRRDGNCVLTPIFWKPETPILTLNPNFVKS
jgi:hypothetical protein